MVGFEGAPERDLFHDPFEDGPAAVSGTPQHLVLLRDAEEDPRVARRADIVQELAQQHGIAVAALAAPAGSPAARLASLVGLVDYTSVYAALLAGVDPTPVAAITALKSRLSS